MSHYVSNPDMVARRIRGESVLVPIARSMDGLDSIISLNETAEFIRARAAEGMSESDIARSLAENFEVPLAEAETDVSAVISELLAIKAITRTGA